MSVVGGGGVANRVEGLLGRLVTANNAAIVAADPLPTNPVSTAGLAWDRAVTDRWPLVAREWERFESGGGRLPRIEDVLSESQGNEGSWCAGLLVADRRPVHPMADRFPDTMATLALIPGLRAALWSVLAPGAVIPEHRGPNCGVFRYHLGVACPVGAELSVGATTVAYADGRSVLFDDTAPHAAANRSDDRRVTLFCEVDRPLPWRCRPRNALTQWVLSLDPRYRRAPRRAAEWDAALNP